MSALWWLIGTVLTALSIVLLAAGLQGKEGVIRIGKAHAAEEVEEDRPAEPLPRSVIVSNIALGMVGVVVGLASVLIFAI